MSRELTAINPVLRVTELLANLVISNDFIEQVKITQVDGKEFT